MFSPVGQKVSGYNGVSFETLLIPTKKQPLAKNIRRKQKSGSSSIDGHVVEPYFSLFSVIISFSNKLPTKRSRKRNRVQLSHWVSRGQIVKRKERNSHLAPLSTGLKILLKSFSNIRPCRVAVISFSFFCTAARWPQSHKGKKIMMTHHLFPHFSKFKNDDIPMMRKWNKKE